MGEARKPEEFDALGEGKIWSVGTDVDPWDTRVDLYFRNGVLSLVAEVGGDLREVPLAPDAVEALRDNLDAWIRWRGVKSRGGLEHRFCPVHGKAWQRVEMSDSEMGPAVKRYVCHDGDIWRTTGRGNAILLPWDEEV